MTPETISYLETEITGGFWNEQQDLGRDVTLDAVYNRFSETGRVDAFKMNFADGGPEPHIFYDSDVAKWMESVAYLTAKRRTPEQEARVDFIVDCMERGRLENGYFNSYFQQMAPDRIFSDRDAHELYCAGHLLEAAVEYYRATGKDRMLRLMTDYMEYIRKVFVEDDSAAFSSPGHEEIELALVKLFDLTGERRWLDLAAHFVDMRGRGTKPGRDSSHSTYNQDHLPVREQFTAEGHAVRACYLYCAMADLALRLGDEGLKTACIRIFDNIVNRKMYVTGGIGSTANGERFEGDFVLPNDTAYAETCASIALALFARRMSLVDTDAKYADIAERVIYNGFLSGLSIDGRLFFYENAQEINLQEREKHPDTRYPITQRVELFSCSCCPPNITRFILSVADFLYVYDGATLFVNQYMDSVSRFDGLEIRQKTSYPLDGNVEITVSRDIRLALRIPGWCGKYRVIVNGETVCGEPEKGYLYLDVTGGNKVTLSLEMTPEFNYADPRVEADRGCAAVSYGPFVMCAEGADNPLLNETVMKDGEMTVANGVFGLPAVTVQADPVPLYMIPYHAFANRGESDMKIWIRKA